MKIEAEIVLKAPCQCEARIDNRLPWEIPTKDKRAVEFWEHRRRAVEKGYEPREKYLAPYLFWEKTNRGKRLANNIHAVVYGLKKDGLVNFWNEYGPLIKDNPAPVSQIMNALDFFKLVSDLWESAARRDELKVRRLLSLEVAQPEVEEFLAIFNGPPQYYRLYLHNGSPMLMTEHSHAVHDAGLYFLKLPAPIPRESSKLPDYIKKVVRTNIRRYLSVLRNFSQIEPLTGKLTVTPPDVMSAALFSLWGSMKSRTFDRVRYQQNRRQRGETTKDEALARFRMRRARGKMSSENYDKLKNYADRIYGADMSRDELANKLEAYFKRYLREV
ncbi:hypothetical protein [Desulfoscipio sp. XC116]|uniref:hypothetical protein n=1 Tax=Desulfoscipio sp. XC116 TaxID=3144975 RepID=UPI00325B68E9